MMIDLLVNTGAKYDVSVYDLYLYSECQHNKGQ